MQNNFSVMSSSKSSRIINSQIVETNASGIVTIVIDDDLKSSNNGMNDEDSNPEFSPTSVTTRPAIGVRIPVPTPGSPKFINSENCQNLMIKENNSNVIVVNSGRSSSLVSAFRSGQTCMSPTSSCCSPDSIPTEFKTHHNIISKTQTHYVVINKPKPTVSTSTPSSTFTSSSSPEFTLKTSPTKLRLWTQPSGQSTPRSPTVIVSTRSRSHTSLPPEDVESDCMDDHTFFKYLNLIRTDDFKRKPRTDLKSSWPLRKVSRIPKPDCDLEGNIILSNFKLLQEPIKTVPNMGPALSERKLRWFREAQHYNERLQKFKANLPMNSVIRQRMQMDLERLHKKLMAEKQRQTIDEEKFRRLKNQEQNQILQKEELKQELDNYSNSFEISSIIGRRVRLSLENSSLSVVDVFRYIENRIENHCKHRDIVSVSAPQTTKLSTRITRSTTGFAGIDRMWGPRNESHQYSFTRKQRLDRYHRLDTGLNWKSRLIKKHCRRIDVEVAKITRCPCCLEIVEPEWGHSCRDSDEESIPEVSSINDSDFCVQSENNFNEEEINSTNSEIINSGDVGNCLCGQCGCNGECIDTTPVGTQISSSSPSFSSQISTAFVDQTLVFSASEALLPVRTEIEEKILIKKVAVLHDMSDIIIKRNVDRKGDSLPFKRINEQNLNPSRKKFGNDLDDDIVIISEVTADSRPQNQLKRSAEPDIIERFVAPNCDTNGSIKRRFSEKRLRSHNREEINLEEIIVTKLD